ncbi:tetratricopeptide repeat-containing protein [Budviciaceae bacterium BWR-B9]|uniref:Tetratricopeptide repeat-containing protein n=1 Tax=Limnobaculum allomyrinae TaxID=2791986 RepID=A0ABS1ILK7_9GAMM|nr:MULTISPECIES: invasion regulator SirB1 [Limnobaculum]MBK5142564.1 tetratricopeptide repeat-containing protein [Limnobaculum allomyrinae]MBV7690551.1 invasion regulator SirB1 [Limnobaculum sp. M2-1]
MKRGNITDFEFNSHPLSEGIYLITRFIRDDFPEDQVRYELDQLAEKARSLISEELDADLQLEQLLELFYHTWGFGGAAGVYNLSDTLWLDKVLKTHQGAPSSLGLILMYIANRLDIPLYPVIFPTQLLIKAEWLNGDSWVINPLNGETLTSHILDVWLKGHLGISATLSNDDLSDAENSQIIIRLLGSLKGALMQENKPELALRASELALSFDPEDPYEIRDRGLIYAQLECNHIAAKDLNYFVEQCPEDPVTEIIKLQLNNIEQNSVTLH